MKTSMLSLMGILALGAIVSGPLAHANSASDMAKVQKLTEGWVSGKDVKIEVSIYNNTDGMPCAEMGVNYVAQVKIRKTVRVMLPNGDVGVDRRWQDFNTYYISKEHLDQG